MFSKASRFSHLFLIAAHLFWIHLFVSLFIPDFVLIQPFLSFLYPKKGLDNPNFFKSFFALNIRLDNLALSLIIFYPKSPDFQPLYFNRSRFISLFFLCISMKKRLDKWNFFVAGRIPTLFIQLFSWKTGWMLPTGFSTFLSFFYL